MMKSTYASPELVQFGSIEALTASSIKCTPGEDTLIAAHSHSHFTNPITGEEGWDPSLDDGDRPGVDNCTNLGDLF